MPVQKESGYNNQLSSERPHFDMRKYIPPMRASQRQQADCDNLNQESPELEVVIEIPFGSFLKHGTNGEIDFVSPFPCPFNYGSVEEFVGLEGDLLDAVVLGPRLPRGARVTVRAFGAVGLTDHGMYDDKLICSYHPVGRWQRLKILLFFTFYAKCKWLLNLFRGYAGRNACEGWGDPKAAIARANPRNEEVWQGPTIPF